MTVWFGKSVGGCACITFWTKKSKQSNDFILYNLLFEMKRENSDSINSFLIFCEENWEFLFFVYISSPHDFYCLFLLIKQAGQCTY